MTKLHVSVHVGCCASVFIAILTQNKRFILLNVEVLHVHQLHMHASPIDLLIDSLIANMH